MVSQIMKDKLTDARRRLERCRKIKDEAEKALHVQAEIVDELLLQLPKVDQAEIRREYIEHSQRQRQAEAEILKRLSNLTDCEIAALKKVLAE